MPSAPPDPPPRPYSSHMSSVTHSARRRSSKSFMAVSLCPHELLDEMDAEKILRRSGTTATHGLSLASVPQTCRASWIQGWDLETGTEFMSYKQGFQRPVLRLRRRTRISNVTTSDTGKGKEGRTSPLADIGLASEKNLRQIRPCPHFPLEKRRDALLRHVHIARNDDSLGSTPQSLTPAQSINDQDLAITLFDHWSCSTCLTQYAAYLFITPHTTSSSNSNSSEPEHPAYSLSTTAWINLGCLDAFSRGPTSNFSRHSGDGSDTKPWLVKSTDWLFSDGEPWVRSPRRVWEEEDRCPRILWLAGIAARGLTGLSRGDVQSWSGVVLSVLSAVGVVMLAKPALSLLRETASAPVYGLETLIYSARTVRM